MNVNGIAAFVGKTQSVSNSYVTSVASAADEATESQATTMKEAQGGDRVAMRKLQQQQQAKLQQQSAQPTAAEPGKGEMLDHHA